MTIKVAVIGVRGLPATYGGIETHCQELYTRLVDKRISVILYARKYYSKENLKEYKGIQLVNIDVPNIKGFEALLYSFISTIHATFSDVDIIHFHAQGPVVFSWIPRIFAPKKKILFTCHGIDWQRDKWGLLGRTLIKLGEKASVRFTHSRIGVSQMLVDYYKNTYNSEMNKIYNGINVEEKLPLKTTQEKFGINGNDYFLFVGRLVPEKAPETIIKAMTELKTNKKLLIVGDAAGSDKYVDSLKELAKDDPRIVFTSYVFGEELKELYSNAFAYISSSKLEGLPITVLEAMSFANIALLSDIEPHKEIYSYDNKCGILFPVNNVEKCRESMNELLKLSDKEILIRKNAAKDLVLNQFVWDKVANETLNLYEQ